MNTLRKVAGAGAATLCILLTGAGAGTAFAATDGSSPHDTGNGYVMVEGNGPAWIVPSGTTAEDLRNREWFVKEEDGVFYYARHTWEEQRRAADFQFHRTVTDPAETETVPIYREWTEHRFEIQIPYWTVESKQIRIPADPPAALMAWLDEIHADDLGEGWWQLPYQVVNGIPGFNPITGPDTGYLNLSVYGGPSVSVWYSKTEVVLSSPEGPYAVEQAQRLWWDGTWWTTNRDAAAWITMDQAPYAGILFDTRNQREQIGTETIIVRPEVTRTFYATADGESLNRADAAWLSESPGEQWTQFGERRLPAWNDADTWHRVVGRDWAVGNDPGPQPDYYEGHTSETQRFRPSVEQWKLTLMEVPGAVEGPDGPADSGISVDESDGPADSGTFADEPDGPADSALFETGGTAGDTDIGIPAVAAIVATGALVAGGIAIPYVVTRRLARKR